MKAKYLGIFYQDVECSTEDYEIVWKNTEDEEYQFNDEFMVVSDSIFTGVMGETNTSAIALKLNADKDTAKLWRIY